MCDPPRPALFRTAFVLLLLRPPGRWVVLLARGAGTATGTALMPATAALVLPVGGVVLLLGWVVGWVVGGMGGMGGVGVLLLPVCLRNRVLSAILVLVRAALARLLRSLSHCLRSSRRWSVRWPV